VLFYGILGALVFRAVFVALARLLLQFHWVVWLFGAFLILTGLKCCSPGQGSRPRPQPAIRLFRRFVPVTTTLHGQRFFVRRAAVWPPPRSSSRSSSSRSRTSSSRRLRPAIYALTDEPLIVFTSNCFAILGLRALYFLLGGASPLPHAEVRPGARADLRGAQDGVGSTTSGAASSRSAPRSPSSAH